MYVHMAELLQPGKIGDFELDVFEISNQNRSPWREAIPHGTYARLRHRGECVMSETPMEKRTNSGFVHNAHGDVFIAGLGIGMIVLPIQDRDNVRSITILEKYPEVISLVGSQLPLNHKIKIIQGDVFSHEFPKGTFFDSIYFDIWNYVNSEVWREEMKPLKRRYLKYKRKENPNAFIECWAEYQAKTNRQLY
jgi:hypothetical protein